ncbi:DUF4302 domain-containing protein [Niabella sp. CC-SYL272]|uniref:DUF4302 domain-containing protein n=1 Tax=Niabella agricola TaxID=2891571 RepID=UPI001F309FDE|nr:DUF4302 domain-containing protein [Niabella agricola]MCF3110446.1 DUF4302 domain-containing protein [Niabella agricola]
MRKLLYILLGALLFSCSKAKVDYVFDQLPEQRMKERNAALQNLLTGSANGWKAFLRTSLNGGGYGFYMKFDSQDYVTMLSDWNNTYATTGKQSTYRVQYISNSTLIFDTYNYIGILQDPTASNNGGSAREGLQSDMEFEYLRSNGDSVILKGRKYMNTLYLIKASAADAASYNNGEYGSAIQNYKAYNTTNPFTFINVDSAGKTYKVALAYDYTKKLISYQTVRTDQSIAANASGFAFSIDGLFFTYPFTVLGTKVTSIVQTAAGAYSMVDSSGKKYDIQAASAPIIPLYLLLGPKYKLQAKFKKIDPGNSALGTAIIGQFVNNLDNGYTGYTFGNGTLTLNFDNVNKRLKVEGWSNQNGNAGWTTTIVFDYTVNSNNEYTFTLKSPASDGYVAKLMNEPGKETIQKFLLENKVTFDYFVSNGVVYGRVTSVNNPAYVLVFDLV